MIRRPAECQVKVQENMRGGPGSVRIQHLWQPGELKAKTRLCAHLTIAPGSGIGQHEHVNEEEVFVVISGRGLINDNGVETTIGPGDSILTGNGAGHAVTAIGDEPLEMLAFIVTY